MADLKENLTVSYFRQKESFLLPFFVATDFYYILCFGKMHNTNFENLLYFPKKTSCNLRSYLI